MYYSKPYAQDLRTSTAADQRQRNHQNRNFHSDRNHQNHQNRSSNAAETSKGESIEGMLNNFSKALGKYFWPFWPLVFILISFPVEKKKRPAIGDSTVMCR